jgi:ribosome-binding protein aMBF1 (putative translation factor)
MCIRDRDSEQMKTWFSSHNITLESSPLEMCKECDGIERVADQLRKLKQSESSRQDALAVVEFSHNAHTSKMGAMLH